MILARKNPQTGDLEVLATGKVGKDADYRMVGSKAKASFSLKYAAAKDEKGKRSQGLFLNCVAWGELADFAGCLEAGDTALVCGMVSERKYTAKDGSERVWTELVCDFILPQPSLPQEAAGGFSELEDNGESPPFEDGPEAEPPDYVPSI